MKNPREDQLQHKGRKKAFRVEADHLRKRTDLLKKFPCHCMKKFLYYTVDKHNYRLYNNLEKRKSQLINPKRLRGNPLYSQS